MRSQTSGPLRRYHWIAEITEITEITGAVRLTAEVPQVQS